MSYRRALAITLTALTILGAGWFMMARADERLSGESPHGGAVAGRLLYSSGEPAAYVPVILRGGLPARAVFRAATDSRGRFRVDQMKPGSYRLFELRVYLNAKTGRCEVLARRDVDVKDGTLNLGDQVLAARTIMPTDD